MPGSAPQDAQDAADAPEAVEPSASAQAPLALPAPPERPAKPNGATNGSATPAATRPRPAGRPRGSVNKDKLAIRRWMSPKAKKLTLKQVNVAHQIFDAALAGEEITDARLQFAGSVAKQAREYAYGKPTESREISGPDGGPITTEALLPMEQMQRLGALFAAHQVPQPPDGALIDVTPETVADDAESDGGAANRASTAGRADD